MTLNKTTTISEALSSFLSNLQKEEKNTHKAYKYDIIGAGGFLDSSGLTIASPISELSVEKAIDFIQHQFDENKSLATRRRRASAVKVFLKYIAFEYGINFNIAKFETAIRVYRLLKGKEKIIYFPEEKIKKILEYTLKMKPAGIQDIRDICFVWLGVECGLRVSDVENAKFGDIQLIKDNKKQTHITLTVIGKGGKQATLRLGEKSRNFLKKYLKMREPMDSAMGIKRSALPLFSRHDSKAGFNAKGETKYLKVKPINVNAVEKAIHRIAYLALGEEYDERITYHKLRHYFGTMAYRHKKDIMATQKMMRHAKAETTFHYTHLEDDASIETSIEVFG